MFFDYDYVKSNFLYLMKKVKLPLILTSHNSLSYFRILFPAFLNIKFLGFHIPEKFQVGFQFFFEFMLKFWFFFSLFFLVWEMKETEKKKYPIGADNYELLEEIGQGVSAHVHRARCIPLNEIVAIKVLDFERENCDLVNSLLFFYIQYVVAMPLLVVLVLMCMDYSFCSFCTECFFFWVEWIILL